ncbi:hypothetical protein ACGF8D_12400 [Streptomyces massasporeus]|uniref:hypothetical protein n=1 Tax=Streptomyces massasporeus TaxID=67324 RepID=UPI003715581E
MPNPSHGFDPALFHEAGLLAQRVTEHRAEAEVTVEARPVTFTQRPGCCSGTTRRRISPWK